jgi:hypothetical protein
MCGDQLKETEPIDLAPRYSSSDVPGRCLKCLAEDELNHCLFELLRGEGNEKELVDRFETLGSFLKSPELQTLRDESERYLAEGKKVSVRIYCVDGKPKYELKIKE